MKICWAFIGFFLIVAFCSCEKQEFTIERVVNAAWSPDGSEVLKIVSLYTTPKPSEVYYNATSGHGWRYKFELCDSTLANVKQIGLSPDVTQGGTLQYVYLYWLPSVQKILTISPASKAVLKALNGAEQVLDPPVDFVKKVYVGTNGYYDPFGIAPSPNGEVIAVYYQAAYFINNSLFEFNYHQSISFLIQKQAITFFSQEIPMTETFPALTDTLQDDNRGRCFFLWNSDGSGIYLVSKQVSYFVSWGADRGIKQVSSVPERPVITCGGNISNDGKKLQVLFTGNTSSLVIVPIANWTPIEELKLIPYTENTYSFW